MRVGRIKASITHPNYRPLITNCALIALTYLACNITDSLMEGESIYDQLFSPARLLLLFFLVFAAIYVARLSIRQTLLEKSFRLHVAAMESSIDGMAIFDPDYKLVYSNEAHTRLYGYDNLEELIGKTWRFFYSEDQVSRFYDEVSPALVNHGEWRGETIGTRKDGSRFPQEVTLTRISSGGIIRIVRDISEKKNYQLELERKARELTSTNRDLEIFSCSLSHDMRSHITRVSSSGQLLLDNYAQQMDETGKFLVQSVNKASEDMEHLVESIQLLASISHSKITVAPVNLSEVVNEIAMELRMSQPDRAVNFLIQPGILATCDPNLVKVALDNLLRNAWKYTGLVSPAMIEFGVQEIGRQPVLFLRDNGVGFEAEEADKLFEPFLRLSSAQQFPGTGIGLATVQRVIQLHKGELWGIGEPGKGATFYFSFPEQES